MPTLSIAYVENATVDQSCRIESGECKSDYEDEEFVQSTHQSVTSAHHPKTLKYAWNAKPSWELIGLPHRRISTKATTMIPINTYGTINSFIFHIRNSHRFLRCPITRFQAERQNPPYLVMNKSFQHHFP